MLQLHYTMQAAVGQITTKNYKQYQSTLSMSGYATVHTGQLNTSLIWQQSSWRSVRQGYEWGTGENSGTVLKLAAVGSNVVKLLQLLNPWQWQCPITIVPCLPFLPTDTSLPLMLRQ